MAASPQPPKSDQSTIEARAKILWGESPAAVLAFLRDHGQDDQSARELIAQFNQERDRAIRDLAVAKIIHGGLLILTPITGYFFFFLPCLYFIDRWPLVGVLFEVLFRITFFLGLYGLWKLIDGIFKYFFRATQTGDLADFTD